MNSSRKILSIVIPVYNGEEFLANTLEAILAQEMHDKVEIVLCDDASTDRTIEIAQEFNGRYGNIRILRNTENLGMDRNFEKVADHGTGEYIWFCGQDDVIGQGAIEKVLTVLAHDAAIDFIYMNYTRYNHDMKTVLVERFLSLSDDLLCADARSFLSAAGIYLPTFLPTFIMRKSLWDRVDKKPFYGTQYIQLGVLLALLPRLRTYIVAHPYVKGRVPDTGWQSSESKVLDIYTGYLEVITYYFRKAPDLITGKIYRDHFGFCWKAILPLLYKLRIEGGGLNQKISDRFARILDRGHLRYVRLVMLVPRRVLVFARNMKRMYAGLASAFTGKTAMGQ